MLNFFRLHICILALLHIASFQVMAAKNNNQLTVSALRCETLENPTGIDKTVPRFSWKIASQSRGTQQKAYQLIVTSDTLLPESKADGWNSGKVASDHSQLVSYAGKPLHAGETLYWKVRVWDEEDRPSGWSHFASFGIGLLEKTDWKAEYIGFPTSGEFHESPQVCASFQSEKVKGRMMLHVNSLGYHEVYLNGKRAGVGVLTPAVTQFSKRSLVVTYDVTSLVRKGKNDLVIWLGSGWYNKGLPGVTGSGPVVKAQLEQVVQNQRKLILATGSGWKGRPSGYTLLENWRSGRYGGEEVNAALAARPLTGQALEDASWQPVSLARVPDHLVSPQMCEMNRITEAIKPADIRQLPDKSYLVDMGKCLTGWAGINFEGLKKDQVVVLEYADHLEEDGTLDDQRQEDRFIAAGSGRERFINRFNYHGFRYIRISNVPKIPAIEDITAFLIQTGFETAAAFECSDPDLNRIHDMLFYTLKCLSLGGDLVDCPQFERLGYGGDGNASTVTAQTMFNMGPLYNNWLQAWADCIREDGGMPHTAPNPYSAGGGPYWCGFIITASWNTFVSYGDTLLLQKYYPVMQQWLGFAERYSVDGLLKKWPDRDYRNWYLGDWATPVGVDQKAPASVDLVNNCYMVVCYQKMEMIARLLGRPEDEQHYRELGGRLKANIHQAFFDPAKNSYGTATQIDLSFPLLAGVVPQEITGQVTAALIRETMEVRKGHFATGLVGIPVLTEWAIREKQTDLFYTMLKQRDYPGYLYMVDNGATTTWEHWNGDRSRIHNCYNGIGSWFYQAVGGIRPGGQEAGYRSITIDPQIPQGLTWAKTTQLTPYGTVTVNWELRQGILDLSIDIPVGIRALLALPPGVESLTLSGEKRTVDKGGSIVLMSGKQTVSYRMD